MGNFTAKGGSGLIYAEGSFTYNAPTIMGVTMVVSIVVVLASLLTDIVYAYLDPRIRY